MEGVEGIIPEDISKAESDPQWTRVIPLPGKRTAELLSSDPRIARLNPIMILEYLKPESETGIVLFPGGLDHITDDEALAMGHNRKISVFHLKYPADTSFSIRREIVQLLDYTENKGIKKYHLVAGSWGGIPAFNTAYTLLKEGSAEIESFFTVAAAFQPSDLAFMVREIAGRLTIPAMKIKNIATPGRQIMSRIARGIPDFKYDDTEILKKLEDVPTVILVPHGGKDWLVDARKSHKKYFPTAHIVEYPAYTNFAQKVKTLGGHDSSSALSGIREIQRTILDNPKAPIPIPIGFKKVR